MTRHQTGIFPRNRDLASPPPNAVLYGTVYGLLSAVGYTAANIFLRSVTHCDPVWVSCIKSVPTVVMTVPWLAALILRGTKVMPGGRALLALIAAGTFAQLGGNVLFQIALGVLGMALTVPLTLGAMILTGAVIGRFVLQEQITWRSAISMIVLVMAIVVLSLGSGCTSHAESSDKIVGSPLFLGAMGVGSAIVSGFSYALLGAVIRKSVSGQVLLPTTLFVVSMAGAVSLGSISLFRIGVGGVLGTERIDWALMALAGVANALAFLALTKSLQVVGVVYINALNASQVAMAACAGLLLFGETPTIALLLGVALTGVGLMLMRERRPAGPPAAVKNET